MSLRDVRDLPLGRETIIQIPDGEKFIVIRTAISCKVCDARGEEPEPAVWKIQYRGETANVCEAHMQEFLDSVNDKIEKGAGVKDWFQQ
jgi:hypothetical protein